LAATRPAGVYWLQGHVPTQVREVNFHEGSSTPIDATFVPLRPGLALKTGNECRPEKMLEPFASWA
jgi:hypothetical protein